MASSLNKLFSSKPSLEELALQHLPDPVMVFNQQGKMLRANLSAKQLLGDEYDRFQDSLTRVVATAGHRDQSLQLQMLCEFVASLLRLPQEGERTPVFHNLMLTDQEQKYHASASFFMSDDQPVVAVSLHQVPEQQAAEQRLQRDRTGHIEYDTEGRILYMNPAVRHILGLSEDVLGKSLSEVLPPSVWVPMLADIVAANGGYPTRFTELSTLERGTIGFYTLPLLEGEGNREHIAGFEQVITDFHGRGLDDILYQGAEIGRYKLVKLLSQENEGAYKVVWRAVDNYQKTTDGTPFEVALLFFRPREEISAATAAGTTERLGGTQEALERELAILERLRRLQVQGRGGLRYFPEFQTANCHMQGGRRLFYIAVSYIEGEPLNRYLQEAQLSAEHRLPVREVVHYGRQLFEALRAIHKERLTHRDIKPSNIIITPDRDLRIIDLGIVDDQMLPDILRGSRLYLAPEQVESGRSYTVSDVWAASLVLYQLATGQYPFRTPISNWESLNPMARAAQEHILQENILHRDIPLPSSRTHPQAEALHTLIMEGLTRDATRRPTAGELYRRYLRLERAIAGNGSAK